MDQIIVENVRCFRKRQTVPLSPLTFLVGENSSGKSTFLALVRLAWDLMASMQPLNFNEEPFLLGSYEEIATMPAGSRKPARFFVIGGRSSKPSTVTMEARFVSRSRQPSLSVWRLSDSRHEVRLEYDEKERASRLIVKVSGREFPPKSIEQFRDFSPPPYYLARTALASTFRRSSSYYDLDSTFQRLSAFSRSRPYAFAPIRTRPERGIYEEIRRSDNPEGIHVPYLLASISSDERLTWENLQSELRSFGAASGLFDGIDIRRYGDDQGGPFQVIAYVDGSARYLVDVGYGVSQILPILVDCVRGDEESTFLLQQPETHLHPKAQAELSSFLALLAKQQKKQFLIETHSDYMVDRIRMDVRDHKHGLRPEDVAILYFERQKGEAKIHPLTLDDQGNLLNVPPGFRSFFLEEGRRFLGG